MSAGIAAFAAGMREMRSRMLRAGKPRHRHQRESWFLDAIDAYCKAAWLNRYRSLHRRYERKADHFPAFVGIAAALICYRRLTR